MQVPSSSYRSLPSQPGVYLFLDERNNVIYVGKAIDLKKRVSSYFLNKDLGEKTRLLVSQIKKIRIIKVNSELESLLLEANLIKKFNPKYNVKLTDGKAYPLIRISIKDKYPRVLTARRPEDKKSLYFGPYPNSGAMRLVLKTVRRIFPFVSVLNHPNKPCLYNHLGLCPCPNVLGDGEYKKTIRRIIKFLNGQTKSVISDLIKDREVKSKNEDFEGAREIQRKIDAINLITSPRYGPHLYVQNPNLMEDIRRRELSTLEDILKKNGLKVEKLERIECYDVSSTSGSNVTGSMVVFEIGERNTSLYRRFKIKKEVLGKPNDFLAMGEIISRRLNHDEWQLPNLIIVDGGKGQVSAALRSLSDKNFRIPLIGLAKREETIITPKFKSISLPKNSEALHLLMRIRDEAHRFAINYHKKLRARLIQ